MSEGLTFGDGYTPTLIGQIVSMHASYYADLVGFGAAFEIKVASELASFTDRLCHPHNAIWWAAIDGTIAASIAIDGQSTPEKPAVLHWFIVDPRLQGCGIGHRLMASAMAFCDGHGFPQVELSTFAGLDAARGLYEEAGFTLVHEQTGTSWGQPVTEQIFQRA
ncbi:MAG: GNAT family N-acetyltransferase [Rhizobiales bacterium]|nr:GNAT family N-acetyltransferase [Hyphomicrobiales bacterium]MBO6700050.1 GNAT family N-acetyltransferase [Hyphomicrobiales bacterium]MBO6737785.1 GNAT family N-acetyltransferase [Hyphomicrobiales bacterium]MBO6913158.1 GNAT family N-acetyltransferase [Hyphomicrobiales bacterium]MBO6954202.1 GNAT family N-acetyltransferase [Hyphomicrobiales bacterium]